MRRVVGRVVHAGRVVGDFDGHSCRRRGDAIGHGEGEGIDADRGSRRQVHERPVGLHGQRAAEGRRHGLANCCGIAIDGRDRERVVFVVPGVAQQTPTRIRQRLIMRRVVGRVVHAGRGVGNVERDGIGRRIEVDAAVGVAAVVLDLKIEIRVTRADAMQARHVNKSAPDDVAEADQVIDVDRRPVVKKRPSRWQRANLHGQEIIPRRIARVTEPEIALGERVGRIVRQGDGLVGAGGRVVYDDQWVLNNVGELQCKLAKPNCTCGALQILNGKSIHKNRS